MSIPVEDAIPGGSLSIELTDAYKSLKEIFYSNGKGSIFSYKPTRNSLIAVLISGAFAGLFFLLSWSNLVVWVCLFCVAAVWCLVAALFFAYKAHKYLEWKRKVNTYLKEVSQYKKYYLNLNSQTFELIHENETIIEKWKSVRKVSLSATHIQLYTDTGTQYLFPAAAMLASDYEALKKYVSRVMEHAVVPL